MLNHLNPYEKGRNGRKKYEPLRWWNRGWGKLLEKDSTSTYLKLFSIDTLFGLQVQHVNGFAQQR